MEEKDASGRDPGDSDAAHDDVAVDRDQAAAERDASAPDRDPSEAAADVPATESDRDVLSSSAGGERPRDGLSPSADGERPRDGLTDSTRRAAIRQRSSDRDLAAADRERAAAGRREATSGRIAAAQERLEAKAELRRAQIDTLTGAFGRKLGMIALEREVNRARHENGRLVLAYIDVNGLKALNEREGRDAGDQLLRDVVSAIRAHVRSYDPVIRMGGDEFVCALGDAVLGDARRRFQQIAATLGEIQPQSSISVGFATLRPQDTVEQLTQRGDAALSEAKRARR